MSEIIHKTEPIEHWIVDGKAYRLATEKDVGKEVSSTDHAIGKGGSLDAIGWLNGIDRTTELPFSSRGTYWRYAYIQDDSLLQPKMQHVVDCVTVDQHIAQKIQDDAAMRQASQPQPKSIDWTKPVRTKDGRAVRVLCTDGPGVYPVIGLVDGECRTWSWTADGMQMTGITGPCALENTPRRVKKTWWINVFENGSFDYYETKEAADNDRGRGIFACVPFPIDCEEGEGL